MIVVLFWMLLAMRCAYILDDSQSAWDYAATWLAVVMCAGNVWLHFWHLRLMRTGLRRKS